MLVDQEITIFKNYCGKRNTMPIMRYVMLACFLYFDLYIFRSRLLHIRSMWKGVKKTINMSHTVHGYEGTVSSNCGDYIKLFWLNLIIVILSTIFELLQFLFKISLCLNCSFFLNVHQF